MNAAKEDIPVDRDEQAAFWCLGLIDGALSNDEHTRFDAWIADLDNAQAFEAAARVWNAADNAAEQPQMVQMRSAALESFRRANRQRWTKRLSARWYWAGAIAATLLIAIFTAGLLYVPTQAIGTSVGERRIAMLGDGSKLSLDGDSEVDVKLGRARRELTLMRGRAKFDVAKDPLRPFTVTAGNKMVVATGTSFSVEILDGQVHVMLYEGHVAVLDRTVDKPLAQLPVRGAKLLVPDTDLTPGRELVVGLASTEPPTVSAIDPVRSLSWESGQLSFDDEPLASAVARMNRYSAEALVVGDDRAANIRVNGVFTAGDTAAFLEGVTALNPVRVVRAPGKITIESN